MTLRLPVIATVAAVGALLLDAYISRARVPLRSFAVVVQFPSEVLRRDLGFPSTDDGPIGCGDPTLVVRLDAAGETTLNDTPYTRSELRVELSRQLEFREMKMVVIDFEHDVEYGAALEAMKMLESVGAEELVLMPLNGFWTRSRPPITAR